MDNTTKSYKVLVTGERDSIPSDIQVGNHSVTWKCLPVLDYQRLPISADTVERLVHKPADWIIFSSPRAVSFWSEVLLEKGLDFPVETRVACIGSITAEAAKADGFSPDFFPSEPGTEGFLKAFEKNIKPGISLFIPMAEGGRMTLKNRLRERGCEVTVVQLYRTVFRKDLYQELSKQDFEKIDCVIFTSPSSVDAFLDFFSLHANIRIGAIGSYTDHHLRQLGFNDSKILPQGDFSRIEEILRDEQ